LFTKNEYILHDDHDVTQWGGPTFIALTFLYDIGSIARRHLGRIQFSMYLIPEHNRLMVRMLHLLGQSQHLQHLTVFVYLHDLEDEYRSDPLCIPGMKLLQRFRGLKTVTFRLVGEEEDVALLRDFFDQDMVPKMKIDKILKGEPALLRSSPRLYGM
jgi:hypothetical protein